MIDLAAVGVGFGVGFIVAHLLMLQRADDALLRACAALDAARERVAQLELQHAAMQQREAVAAANIVQLSGALTNATAQRAAPVQLGADVLGRFLWN